MLHVPVMDFYHDANEDVLFQTHRTSGCSLHCSPQHVEALQDRIAHTAALTAPVGLRCREGFPEAGGLSKARGFAPDAPALGLPQRGTPANKPLNRGEGYGAHGRWKTNR